MPALGKRHTLVTHYVRNMRGGSQSILAQAGDGLLYVVKFNNNLQGANLPFNESMGNELHGAVGLPCPAWTPLMVTDAFIDRNKDCWMQTPEGARRPDAGLCFGSRFLGGNGKRLLEILPGTSFKRIRNHQDFWLAWMIDICAEHADDRQAIFVESPDKALDAFFFDNGHLFGGPNGELEPHFLASRYLDPRIYQSVSSQYLADLQKLAASLDVDKLWQQAKALPEQWKTTSALSGLERCIKRLSTPILIQDILQTMVDAFERKKGSQLLEHGQQRNSPNSVLFPGVQGAEVGKRLREIQAGCPACV